MTPLGHPLQDTMAMLLGLQVQDLGHDPIASLQARDSRAADCTVDITAASETAGSIDRDSHACNLQEQHQHAQADASSMQGSAAGKAKRNQEVSRDGNLQERHTQQQQQQQQQQQSLLCQPDAEGHRSNEDTAGSSHQGLEQFLREELQQLRDNYLLLQDAYWQQKEQLMAVELQTAQLQATTSQAVQRADQVCRQQGELVNGLSQML
jgi:hypothetical protein